MSYVNKGTIPASVIVSRIPDRSGNFVCDGTADNVEIQAAINYLSTLGGELYLKRGTYSIAVTLTGINNLKLIGEGWEATTLSAVGGVNILDLSNRSDCLIEDIGFEGNATTKASNQALYLHAVTDIKVRRCHFKNWQYSCIIRRGSTNVTIEDNFFEYPGAWSIFVQHTVTCRNVKIFNNFHDGTNGTSDGLCLIRGSRHEVAHNIVYNPQYRGIVVQNDVEGDTYNIDIHDNYVYNIQDDGILISGEGDELTDVYDIDVHDNIVESDGNGDDNGIYSHGDSTTPDNVNRCKFSNNIIIKYLVGMELGGGDWFVVDGNIVFEADNAGISLGCKYSTIDNNIIINPSQATANTWSAIRLWGSVSYPANHNVVSNNICYDDSGSMKYGIEEINVPDYNLISTNKIIGAQTGGVLVNGIETKILHNDGYNPIGIIANPFDTPNTDIELNGAVAVPTANVTYTIRHADIKISSTDSANTDCAIMLKDQSGNNILQSTLSTIEVMYIPVGFQVTWGNFTGAAPTVTVAFN